MDDEYEAVWRQEAEALLAAHENSGIDFDHYDNIPVETEAKNLPRGITAPPPAESFAEMGLPDPLPASIKKMKYNKPTPIQKYAIPAAMAGCNVMACAQTGSGKTAAFMFPMLAIMVETGYMDNGGKYASPFVVIMAPTRELAIQIHQEARKFAHELDLRPVVAYGGQPRAGQLQELRRGADVLIGTPGRIHDFAAYGQISFSQVKFLVLDEADRMLDMGFEPQVREIIEQSDMPPKEERQTMMFSATFPKEVQELAADFMHGYYKIFVGNVGSTTDLIVQHMELVDGFRAKYDKLMDLVTLGADSSVTTLTLVFVATKLSAGELSDKLQDDGIGAVAIHGDMDQGQRERALKKFRDGAAPVLVATDVAARGLDIPNVFHVINFDLPGNIDDYVHRIGRTGRAGNKGLATALYSPGRDGNLARDLVKILSDVNLPIPAWLEEEAAQSSGRPRFARGSSRGRSPGAPFGADRGRSLSRGPPPRGGFAERGASRGPPPRGGPGFGRDDGRASRFEDRQSGQNRDGDRGRSRVREDGPRRFGGETRGRSAGPGGRY